MFSKLTVTPDGAPQFAPFKGFSILFEGDKDLADFDPPWKRLSAESERLYAELASAVDQLKTQKQLEGNAFFALPPSSYHITLWDGFNQDPAIVDHIPMEFRTLISNCT
jgi:hypothetical protein